MLRIEMFSLATALTLAVGVLLTGCGDKTIGQPTGVIENGGGQGPSESLETEASSQGTGLSDEGQTSKGMFPVYFDFDSSTIREDQSERLEKNARYLSDNSEARIRVEGNCDSRGTNEYNLALGERRALNAKKYLINLGIEASRISTVSWGEEKLLLHGHDELSWAQNRRDDFVIIEH